MQFFAHIRPESSTALAWARQGFRRAVFAGVAFTQRPYTPAGENAFRFESELLTDDQIAELKKHPRIVTLETVTNTRVPKAAP